MSKLLQPLLAGLIKTGTIEIETANGYKFTIGDGSESELGLRFNDMSAVFQFAADPALQFGELYIDGRIEVTKGTLLDVLMLAAVNLWRPDGSRWLRLLEKGRGALPLLSRPNSPLRAKRNATHHYDLDVAFYKRFLILGRNILAPISNAPAKISKTRSSPKNATSRRNFPSSQVKASSISAVALVAWRSISRGFVVRA